MRTRLYLPLLGVILGLLLPLAGMSQCPYDNGTNGFPNPFNPSGPGPGGAATSTNSWGGDYLETNVVSGNTYTWSGCGSTSFDAAFSLYNPTGPALIDFNDNFCGNSPQITWTATFTGPVRLLIDQMPGCTNNSVHYPVTVSFVSACTPATITTQPTNQNACPNGTATFTAAASGQDSTRWMVSTNGGATFLPVSNAPPYSGATTGTLTINPAAPGMNGFRYRLDAYACSPPQATSSSQAVLSVFDNSSPTITCPSNQSDFVNGSCQVSLPDFTGLATTSDNCDPSPTVTQSPVAGTTVSGAGTNLTVSLFSQDNNFNSSTCTFTFSTADSTSPAAICQNITVPLSGGTASITPSDVNNGSNDNCTASPTLVSVAPNSFNCSNIGPNTVTLTVQDASSNQGTCTATVTITDPGSSCCTNLSVTGNPGSATFCAGDTRGFAGSFSGTTPITYQWMMSTNSGASWAPLSNGGTNPAISGATADNITFSNLPLSYQGYLIHLVATNPCSVDSTNDATLFGDTTLPAISCPANIAVPNDANICGAAVSYTAPVGTDNCSGANTIQNRGLASGATFPLGATVNSFVVTDASGNVDSCTFSVTVTQTTPVTGIAAAVVDSNVSCNGFSDGGATAAGVNGNGPFMYLWSNSAATPSITGVAAGPYTVTVTDAGGCFGEASITITEPSLLNASIAVDSNVSCNGFSDGGLTASPTGGTSPYTYLWSNSATTASITGVPAGSYTVTVTDANLCSSISSSTVTEPPVLSVTMTVDSSESCPGALDGGLTATPAGGTPPYGYLWSNGATTASITGVSAGTYAVTVTDQNQCSFVDTASVSQNDTTPPTMICNAATVFLDGAYTAAITPGLVDGGSFDACTIDSIWVNPTSVSDTGNFAITLIARDPSGNIDSCTATVTAVDTIPPVAACPSGYAQYPDQTQLTSSTVISGNDAVGQTFTAGLSGDLTQVDLRLVHPSSVGVTVRILDGNGPTATVIASENIPLVTNTMSNYQVVFATPAAVIAGNRYMITVDDNLAIGAIGAAVNTANPLSGGSFWFKPGSWFNQSGVDMHFRTYVSFVGPADTIYLDTAGVATYTAGQFDAGSTDNSGSVTLSINQTSFSCTDANTSPVITLIVTDPSGNVDSCSGPVLVLDTLQPQAICKDTTLYLDGTGMAGVSANDIDGGSFDNCSLTSITLSDTSWSCSQIGANTATLTIVSGNGETASCVSNIMVLDTTGPVITCPANIVQGNDSLDCAATVNYTVTSSDNCSGAVVTQTAGLSSGASYPIGVTTNSFTIVDSSGNADSCTFTVTVNDTEAPSVVCPPNSVRSNDPGQCGAVVNYLLLISDNCIGPFSTQTNGLPSGSTFPVGLTTNAFIVSDSAGNQDSCLFTIIVNDTEKPGITCPPNVTVDTDSAQCSAVVTYTITNTDNCTGDTVFQINGLASGSAFPRGFTINTWVALDSSSNSDSCTFVVSVTDNEVPTITCPANISVNNDAGQCDAVVTFNVTGTDNCPGFTISQLQGLASGAAFPVGTTSQLFQNTDSTGNTDTCSFTVTVTDGEAPVITCPANITTASDTGQCAAVVTYSVNATDNCPGVTTALSSGLASGASFPVGTTTNTWQATDAVGNIDSCSFTVTVTDGEAPVIACPANFVVNNDSAQCAAVVTYTVGSTDNCPGQTVSQTGGLPSGSSFPVFAVTTNSFTVTDAAGNTDTCSFTVTVIDNEAPVITCPANFTVNTDPGQCAANVTYSAPTSTDNCPGQSVTQIGGLGTGSTFPAGITTETYRVSDQAGNADTCSFTVRVIDNEDPVITCPANISVNNDIGQCSAVVNYSVPTATDNCAGVTVSRTGGFSPGFPFPVGTSLISYIAVDTSSNTDTCSFTITVQDAEAPTLNCPANISVNNDPGQCSAVVTYATVTASDNCQLDSLTQSAGLMNGSTFPVGVTAQTYIAVDTVGNSDSCNFTVEVIDAENPALVCPSNQVVYADTNCAATIPDYTSLATASDNCTTTPILSQSPTAGTIISGAGTQQVVTITATDSAANSSMCSFNVTLLDTTKPVFVCPANDIIVADGNCEIVLPDYAGSITGLDACSSPTINTQAPLAGTVFSGAGNMIPVTITIADSSGNADSCTFMVSILDTTPPAVTCPVDTVLFADAACQAQLPDYTAVGTVSDNCDASPSFTQSPAAGFVLNGHLDSVRVWLTGADTTGNADSCSFVVTLLDTTPPTLNCPPNQFAFNDAGQCGAVVSYPAVTASDFCYTVTPVQDSGLGTGSFFPVGVTNEAYTAMDSAGNSVNCLFTVTVIDAEAPVFSGCPMDTTVILDSTQCDFTYNYTAPTATDNCIPDTVFSTHNPGAVFTTGVDTVMYTVIDVGGNQATCQFIVTVMQDPLSAITAANVYPGGFNVSCNGESNSSAGTTVSGGCIPYQYNWSTGDMTDSISGYPAGTYLVTITDGSGRMLIDSVTITEPAAISDTLITLIGGEPKNCVGDTVTFMAAPGFVSYMWNTGDTTQSIDISATGTFQVEVTDSIGCTAIDTMSVQFEPWIDPFPVITPGGDITLCQGDSVLLDVGGGYFRYEWNTGDSTRSIMVTSSGSYWAKVFNGFGCERVADTVNVMVAPNPPAPTITLVGDTLFSTPGVDYQWYLDSVLVAAENPFHVPTASGPYYVVVFDSNGCSSASNVIDFIVGIGEGEMGEQLSIYPNPFGQEISIELSMGRAEKVGVQIIDVVGQILWQETTSISQYQYFKTIELNNLANGIYYVRITAGDQKWVRKVIKQ